MQETIRRASRGKGFPILLGVFLALVVIMIWEAASSHAGYSVTTETESGEVQKIRIREGRWHLAVELAGDVELTGDERGIARLGPAAYLEIEERRRRQRRRLEATPGAGGEPEIAWFVNRQREEFDGEAEEWLAAVLPRIYRATGLDAEGRVRRILAAAGTQGVLSEIGEIGRDGIQRIYFKQLLALADPDPADLSLTLRRLAREIGSDREMRQVLAAIPARQLADDRVAKAFAAAAGTIGSDHELRQVLSECWSHADLVPEAHEGLLEAAASIGNDYDLAELLVELAASYPADRQLPSGYDRALATIGTDHEQRKAILAGLKRPGLGAEDLEMLLRAAGGLGSDFDLAELLIDVARTWEGTLPRSYFRALATIGSDFELARVLAAAVERPNLGGKTLVALLDSSIGIGSDHEMARWLIQVLEQYPIDKELRPAFERAAATIGSDYERQRVSEAASREGEPPAALESE